MIYNKMDLFKFFGLLYDIRDGKVLPSEALVQISGHTLNELDGQRKLSITIVEE